MTLTYTYKLEGNWGVRGLGLGGVSALLRECRGLGFTKTKNLVLKTFPKAYSSSTKVVQ